MVMDPAFAPASADPLCRLTAVEAVAALRRGDVSPLDLLDAAETRIAATDGRLNALPTLCFDRARDRARRLMQAGTPDRPQAGWLAGLPIAVKDLLPVAGVRCTWGSPIYADHVPDRSDILVERLEARGAVVAAKSNTPEFGAGASTFNAVFGKTRNPWNTDRSVAGSSGGTAAALAAHQLWLGTGSDLGGSLRTPAGFCGIVGLRPSPGRVARGPEARPFNTLSVEGPMGRTAADTALLLDAMAGGHIEDPLAQEAPAVSFVDQVALFQRGDLPTAVAAVRRLTGGGPGLALPDVADARLGRPVRAVWSPDLGGITPIDPAVAAICAAAARRLPAQGVDLVDLADLPAAVRPDFTEAPDCFQVLRAAGYAAGMAALLQAHRDRLKPEVIWNIEQGQQLTASEIGAALLAQGRLCAAAGRLFTDHDVLLCPTAIVPPFDVDWRWVERCGDVRFDTYIDWLRIVSAITLTGCPVASVPAGVTADGLPVGIQVVAPPRMEAIALGIGDRIADPRWS